MEENNKPFQTLTWTTNSPILIDEMIIIICSIIVFRKNNYIASEITLLINEGKHI